LPSTPFPYTTLFRSRARDRGREEPARLQAVQRGEIGLAAGDVEVLAADHAERRLDELARHIRRRVRQSEPERLREQRVASQDPHALPALRPRAGPPAPPLVVVQRGETVVDAREVVDERQRGGC